MTKYIKQSTVKAMITVARRGKKRISIDPAALSALTALVNMLIEETLSRAAQTAANTGDRVVKNEHLQRIITQIMTDFAV